MKMIVEQTNQAVALCATNERGLFFTMDGSVRIGGENKGVSPMEALLGALAGCSSMDVLSILKKMRVPLQGYRVEIEGERATEQIPAIFKKIHIHYIFLGDIESSQAEKAIRMSLDTYCSISKMLEKSAEISFSIEIKRDE